MLAIPTNSHPSRPSSFKAFSKSVAGHGRGPAAPARAIAGASVSLSLPINRVSYSHFVAGALCFGLADPSSVMIVSHKSGHYLSFVDGGLRTPGQQPVLDHRQ